MKKAICSLGIAVMLAGLIAGCAAPAPAPTPAPAPAPTPSPKPAQPITLKAVTFMSRMVPNVKNHLKLFDRINERAKGELTIQYLGGPEAIGAREQPLAVKKGVVDIATVPASYYSDLVPVCDGIVWARQLSGQEERQQGVYNFFQELHSKAGFFYLGRQWMNEFEIQTTKKVDTPYDLVGQRVATTVFGIPLIKALGMSQQSIPDAEVYTALQLGVVHAVIEALITFQAEGLQEVAKYIIDHPFGQGGVYTIINLDTWNSLPKNLQDLIIKVQMEREGEFLGEWKELENKARQGILDKGAKFIKFPPADAKWYLDTIYKAEWGSLMTKLGAKYPELVTKTEELLSPR